MRVGMNRAGRLPFDASRCFPHASGDEPPNRWTAQTRAMLSPCEWGVNRHWSKLDVAVGALLAYVFSVLSTAGFLGGVRNRASRWF